jgi:hypothetical protein
MLCIQVEYSQRLFSTHFCRRMKFFSDCDSPILDKHKEIVGFFIVRLNQACRIVDTARVFMLTAGIKATAGSKQITPIECACRMSPPLAEMLNVAATQEYFTFTVSTPVALHRDKRIPQFSSIFITYVTPGVPTMQKPCETTRGRPTLQTSHCAQPLFRDICGLCRKPTLEILQAHQSVAFENKRMPRAEMCL